MIRICYKYIRRHIPQDVLSGSDAGRQRDIPSTVLGGESLASPRDFFTGIVSGLINLDPDISRGSRELAASTIAAGEVSHDWKTSEKSAYEWDDILTWPRVITLPVCPEQCDRTASCNTCRCLNGDVVGAVSADVTGDGVGLDWASAGYRKFSGNLQ